MKNKEKKENVTLNVLKQMIEHQWTKNLIIAVIVVNSIVLGLSTINTLPALVHTWLHRLDKACIGIFLIELVMKLVVYKIKFFKSGWNIFDALIVGIAILPSEGIFSIFRALRIIRALRLLSQATALKRVVDALAHSIPGIGSTSVIILLIYYVFSVMGVHLFGTVFPQWFGHLGRAAFSLFQVMTLESWSMGIVRPIMRYYPYAWLYFIPFILISAFVLLNFLIGIIVDAIAHLRQDHREDKLLKELTLIHHKIDEIESRLPKNQS